jgi:subtilisin-like proprotein convertase family protein
MRFRPITWFVLSLLLFAGAAWFWHIGEQRRKGSVPSTPRANSTQTVAAVKSAVTVTPSNAAAPGVRFVATASSRELAAQGPAKTNEAKYRLTNTTKPLAQLIRDPQALLLRNAFLDVANPSRPAIPESLRAKSDPGAYVVQSRGALNDAFRQQVRTAGAEIVSYIPNNAMLVRATAAQAEALKKLGAVMLFEPYYKLDERLLAITLEKKLSPYGELNIVAFPGETERAQEKIKQLGGQPTAKPERTPFGDNLAFKIPASAIADVAQLSEVHLVGVRSPRQLLNDLARVRVKVSTNAATPPPNGQYIVPNTATANLTGTGVKLAVVDSGVDEGHPDLYGRVFGIPLTDMMDANGHGTHVIGTILGSGERSFTVPNIDSTNSAAQGSTNSAWFNGMAPQATADVFPYNAGLTDAELQTLAATNGANVVNNSWAYDARDYDIFAASYDAAVRDALPGTTGEQQLTMVFAAGNSGNGENNGLGGTPGSIQSPATAKNVITVGGSELLRRITNSVTNCNSFSCETNLPWFGGTDSYDQISSFSSRGNVGIGLEGPYGRFKPDVIAPGSMLVSCRSATFAEGGASVSVIGDRYNFLDVPGLSTNIYSVAIPQGCGQVTITVADNAQSPLSVTTYPIGIAAEMDALPPGPPVGNNSITLDTSTTPAIAPGTLYYSLANTFSNDMNVDLIVQLTITNNVGNYFEVLSNMNYALGTDPDPRYYRYEQGTSMSAGVVSGMLALMEEFFRVNFGVTNSPALNKALLINGARSLGIQYNVQVQSVVNHQGWGLVNMSNTIPPGITSATAKPLWFFDQSNTNALATGDSQVYTITVPPQARSSPLRVSLVWTDPAGNPASSLKLVNDLDAYVEGPAIAFQGTNVIAATNRWVGNHFGQSSDFTQPIFLADTNGSTTNDVAAQMEAVRDAVNNVENVYIAPPLGDTYTLTVRGTRVAVNAVNSHSNGIVQDYALVVSSGNGVTNSAGITVSGPVANFNGTPIVTAMQRNGQTNAIVLVNQHVGANSPYLTTTNGMTNQWAFYTFTNMTSFTNVAFITFMPPNMGFLRPDPFIDPREPRHSEADIDLYVARSFLSASANYYDLTNLDAKVIADSDRSTRRGGTEFVIYSNSVAGEVFYVGVKSEDQQSATFGLFAIASEKPLNQKESNNIIAQAMFLPVPIPDGTPDLPGGTNIFAFVFEPGVKVQRVYVTNSITHEDAGDLIGTLLHNDSSSGQYSYATLNNHRYWFDFAEFVYDDSEQGDITNSIPTDGPGSLKDFVGHDALGLWTFAISDNAMFHTGSVEGLTLVIEPASTNDNLPVDLIRTIAPNKWLYAPFDVGTPDITNAHACVAYQSGSAGNGPVNLYLRRQRFPTLTAYDKALLDIMGPNGDCLDLGLNDSPPLSIGRYFAGVYNSSASPVTIRLTVRLDRSLTPVPAISFASTNSTPLIDDATTNATLFIATQGLVSAVEVDVRLDHPRASDLVLYLKNPQGTRVMLAENRGRTNTMGYGYASSNIVITNLGKRVLEDSFEYADPTVSYYNSGAYPAGQVISGWTVGSGNVDVVHVGIGLIGPSHTGANGVDLNGTTGGSVFTNVVTKAGQAYLLSFAHCRNPDNITPASVTATVELGSVVSNDFTYAYPNSYANPAWSNRTVLFVANSNMTTVRFRSKNPSTGAGGMFIDTIKLDEVQVGTNSTLYATFTEDPAKFPVPIKFAPPPFGETNFRGTNVFISGFEVATNRAYMNGEFLDSWLTFTNTVYVESNNAIAYSDTNYLYLRTGGVRRVLATEPGKEYVLQFVTRTDGRIIYNTGVDADSVPLNSGEVDGHYTTNATAGLAISNAYVLATNAMLANFVTPTSGVSRWIGIHPTSTPVPVGPYTYRTEFNLSEYDTNTVRLQCRFATDDQLVDVRLNGLSRGFFGGSRNAFSTLNINNGFRQWTNVVEFIVSNITASAHGFRAEPVITGSLRSNAVPRSYTAVGEVRLLGSATNQFTAVSGGWNVQSLTFVARSNNTVLEFEGVTPGVWLDHVQIRDTGRKYYWPEEPMAPLLGKSAFGEWNLEIWDSRLGAFVTGTDLLSWRLRLAYVRTNPPLIVLTNTIAKTVSLGTSNIQYFAFDVPCEGATVQNVISASTGPVDWFFNQDTFPLTTQFGDVVFGTNVFNPTQSLTEGFYPLVRTGRYFLGVRAADGQPVTFTITASYACPNYTTALSLATSGVGANGMSMSWSAAPGSEFKVLYTSDPAGPWTEVPKTFTAENGQFSFIDDGSLTGGLPTQRFYKIEQTK